MKANKKSASGFHDGEIKFFILNLLFLLSDHCLFNKNDPLLLCVCVCVFNRFMKKSIVNVCFKNFSFFNFNNFTLI
jgi:hypothetical protein